MEHLLLDLTYELGQSYRAFGQPVIVGPQVLAINCETRNVEEGISESGWEYMSLRSCIKKRELRCGIEIIGIRNMHNDASSIDEKLLRWRPPHAPTRAG